MRMEVDAGGAAVLLRTMPLVVHGVPAGAALLIRDVTEVKRRDRALLSKDATIREIHHRVKNNLQIIASLLSLQSGYIRDPLTLMRALLSGRSKRSERGVCGERATSRGRRNVIPVGAMSSAWPKWIAEPIRLRTANTADTRVS